MTKHIFNVKYAEKLLSALAIEAAWARADPKSEYHDTYNAIVNFSTTVVDDCKEGSDKVLACATYGWMPTIMKGFNLANSNLEQPIYSIRHANGKYEALCLLQKMGGKGIIKNSWIGTSKFMHFLNPSTFPIWDTRVAEKFSEHCINHALKREKLQSSSKMPSAYSFANKLENYQKYTSFMLSQLELGHEWLRPLADIFCREKGYRPTDLRLLELMLFHK